MGKPTIGIILSVFAVILLSTHVQARLRLLNVVFRHGDRAPDNNGLEMYPKDPYINMTFEPMRLGGLTNAGKLREYELGQYLRKQYGDFLGKTYYAEEVSARSTNVDRTKMSLQLVLASLYPPTSNQTWNEEFDWQPIPANYIPSLDDNLMVPEECPKYLRARERVEASHEVRLKLKYFRKFMQFLSRNSGKDISNSNDMYFLYHGLMAEYAMGLPLPEWTKNIFPYGKLLDGINLEYEIFSYNEEMRRLNGGMLLRKFIENMKQTINTNDKHKIYLYSGHETNVAAVLQVLGVYTPHVPEYTSGVFVELHEEGNDYFVQLKYYKGIPGFDGKKHEDIIVPGCTLRCPLKKFLRVLHNVIPSDEETKCDKRSLRYTFQKEDVGIPSGIVKQISDAIHKEDKVRGTLQ